MNRTTARIAVTVAGFGALTGLAVGAAHADEADSAHSAPSTGETEAAPTASSDGPAPNYVLHEAPGLPIGDPVSALVFPTIAPAYAVIGAF